VSGVSRVRSVVDRLLEYLAQIGADPQDDDDTRAGKALLVLISVLILPVALLWAALYLAFGSPVGWVPLAYFAVLLASIVVFSRTRSFGTLLRVTREGELRLDRAQGDHAPPLVRRRRALSGTLAA
jgi:hypothetical protein